MVAEERAGDPVSDQPMRLYVCPVCGYDGFKASKITTTVGDVNVQYGCPACMTKRGLTVWLVETMDPRTTA